MKKSSFPYVMAIGCIVFMVIAGLQQMNTKQVGVYSVSIHVADYTLQGPPTVTAAFIDQVLTDAGSEASGSGAALYTLGVTYGIDPVYASRRIRCGRRARARRA